MKIVITGGLGFIGQALARQLIADGHGVLLVDALSAQIHGVLPFVTAPEGAKVARVDVRELADKPELFEGAEAVFHLAAETGTAQSMYRIGHYVAVNDGGTAALLEAICKCKRRPNHVLLASSRSVYGEGAYVSLSAPGTVVQPAPRSVQALAAGAWDPLDNSGMPLRAVPTPESLAFAPGSVYAATKAAQELLLSAAGPALGFRTTVLRFQNVYGEGQSLQNPYTGIISIFFNRARQGLDIPIYEDGLESRDFVHVSDIVSALRTALVADLAPSIVMNLGAGVPTTVSDLATTLLSAAGLKVPLRVTGQFRAGDIRHCYADLTRAKRHLGFTPQVTLSQGLQRFCAWAVTQAVFEDRSVAAAAELRAKGLAN
jgi:dTDP-L-rhamnose 4-epimerase